VLLESFEFLDMPLVGNDRDPLISVIIPSYNSEKSIAACLAALTTQQVEADYEIILIDSSTDHTPEIVRTQFAQIRYYHFAEKTPPGRARNEGIARARGKIVALTDSDCIVSPHWLQEILTAHATGYRVIGGSVRNAFSRHPISIAEYYLEFREFSSFSPRREIDVLPTNNLAVQRDIFERFGAFSDLRASEDVAFIHKLRQHGIRVLFEPRIWIRHLNRRAMRPFLRNQHLLGFNAALARRLLPLPGAALVRHPYLLPLLPFIRILRTMQFILQNRWPHNAKQGLEFMLTVPFFILGASSWSWGFYGGSREADHVVADLRAKLQAEESANTAVEATTA